MKVSCPECDAVVELTEAMAAAGVPKVRCPHCPVRFQILPGGAAVTLAATGSASGGSAVAFGGNAGGAPVLTIPAAGGSGAGGGGAWSVPGLEAGAVVEGRWRIEDAAMELADGVAVECAGARRGVS